MSSSGRPFVAVIGGLGNLDPAILPAAKSAGIAIGAELAKAGFGLVVYFSNEESLEPHVVSGYVPALGNALGAIRVRYAESERGKIRFPEEATWPELFEHRLFPGTDWEAPFYRSLAEDEGVDAILLLGGDRSTFIAGQIAVARKLPVLAIDEFGGSAAKIWGQLAQALPDQHFYSWGTRPPATFVARLKEQCAAVAARRQESLRREQIIHALNSQSRKIVYAGSAFIMLLAALFTGIVYTPIVSAYPIVVFSGLVAAGATGALVRAMLWSAGETDSRASFVLGGIAGFVVGLAYLIPQWVGAPGPLEPKAITITAIDKIQFASAVLVAVSAGVGFDTVFSRLQKQAQDIAVGPPR